LEHDFSLLEEEKRVLADAGMRILKQLEKVAAERALALDYIVGSVTVTRPEEPLLELIQKRREEMSSYDR